MTLTEFVNRAVGVPFLDGGRDDAGWDCYGLVYCGCRDVLGIEIPAYAGFYKSTKQARLLMSISERELATTWSPVAAPQPMDGILLRVDGRPLHVGLVLDRTRFLHVEEGKETCVQEFDGLEWRQRVLGFYRLKPQAAMAS